MNLLQRLREYRVPALNRGESITVNLLVHAVPPTLPYCLLATDAPGVVTVFRKSAEQEVIGVPVFRALALGVVIAYPAAQLIILRIAVPWQSIALVVLGTALTLMGALVARGYRWIRQHAF